MGSSNPVWFIDNPIDPNGEVIIFNESDLDLLLDPDDKANIYLAHVYNDVQIYCLKAGNKCR